MNCPKCGSDAWDWANIGFTDAKQCTDCGEIYSSGEKIMKTYNVYVEDTNGNYMDDYTLEANSESHAYDLAYERHNYKPLTIYVDLEEHSTMLQDTYFDGKHPLESFPSIFGGK